MKIIMSSVITFAVVLLAPQITQAQGTMTYLSSLSQTSTGSPSVGSDSWLAAPFITGPNASGYSLNSIQLGMADASGNPSGFTAMLYSAIITGAILPGSSLGTLDGSLNPVIGGIFTYTPVSSLTLSPHTYYFIVLTAGTTIANGAYSWSMSTFPPSSSGDWSAGNVVLQSGNGTSGWSPTPYLGIAQFAINATAIPEPGVLSLFGLGGLGFLWHRRKARAV
jgi:hypothetical protein